MADYRVTVDGCTSWSGHDKAEALAYGLSMARTTPERVSVEERQEWRSPDGWVDVISWGADAAADGFQLARESSSAPKPLRVENNERNAQRMLLSGLDCLPGQRDLFATDGEG